MEGSLDGSVLSKGNRGMVHGDGGWWPLAGLQYLVVHLLVSRRQRYRLLEDIIVLSFKLDRLPPVIKRAGHKDLVGSMWPGKEKKKKRLVSHGK